MHPSRPQVPRRPCPACGAPVDPLRAGQVVLLEDGFRYLCDDECRVRFLKGERSHEQPEEPDAVRVSVPDRVREATRPSLRMVARDDSSVAETAGQRAVFSPRAVPVPWLGIGAAAAAFLLAMLPGGTWVAAASAALTCIAAGAALTQSASVQRDVGLLAWGLGPMGAMLAALAALLAFADDPTRWPSLAGASLAALAMVARAWLEARARQPVGQLLTALSDCLPRTARVPVHDDAVMDESYEEVPAKRVRVGQEVLSVEGEIVPVDGVVRAGEAWVLLHPSAQTRVRRGPGDPVLAGARVEEGAVRILATRIGDDRALMRPALFASSTGPDAARVTQLAIQATRWGGLAAVAGAVAALSGLAARDAGVTGHLSAAAAVLLAAPLLAARRAAEAPLAAAAAAAIERGIAFGSARGLSRAGNVTVTALCLRGVVTEGNPEVTELRPLGDADGSSLMALAAAAESAAGGHPIARAVRRYADRHRVPSESVRRAVYIEGRGVTAVGPGGEPFVLGNRQLLLDEGVSIAVADAEAEACEARGLTALLVGLGGRVRAVLALQDDVRPGARAAVQRLFDLGIEVVLLSGDHHGTVEALAHQLDVAHVKAELTPEERVAEVRRLRETGGAVAVFGRAAHDDAVMAAADVPVVLGAAGAHTGELTVALATDDLRDGAAALWIARATRLETWRGVLIAMGGGGLLVAAAAFGWAAPAVAAVGSVAIDAFALPAGARLLRRIELRVPARR